MPLLLIDLDDSLIDRSGSFAAWARGFCAECGRDGDLDWLIEQSVRRHPDRDRLAAVLATCSVLVSGRPAHGDAEIVAPGSSVELLPPFAGG